VSTVERSAAVPVEVRGAGSRAWPWARALGGALMLAVLVQRLGTGPFLDGLRGLGPGVLLAAIGIGCVTTVCSAWRWRVVAGALGMDLPLGAATAAYYRSQLLNCTLPGGILGDVDRGLRHGADAGQLGRGVRAVVWERTAGQGVQLVAALVALILLPSPVHRAMPAIAGGAALAAALVLVAGRGARRHGPARLVRGVRTAAVEIRGALLHPTSWPTVLLTSLLVVAGHVGMFMLAALASGVHGEPLQLLPLALIVLLAAAIPLNLGGWGPREGVAVWVFAAAGWPAGTGASVATAFGVLVLVSVLPGAGLLLADWLRLRWRSGSRSAGTTELVPGERQEDGALHR
jgi:uncharacterized membrane protein YbhN (UPF0104 family)